MVEDGLEEVVGSGGSAVEVSGMLQNKLFLRSSFFLIANFNVLVAAIVNSLLAVLRQIRRALSFVAQCILQGVQSSAPRRSSPSLDTGNQAAVVVKDRVGKSAKERVVRKWGNGV